eukprot:3184757-Alexandrium_andersonii.AAC.1
MPRSVENNALRKNGQCAMPHASRRGIFGPPGRSERAGAKHQSPPSTLAARSYPCGKGAKLHTSHSAECAVLHTP